MDEEERTELLNDNNNNSNNNEINLNQQDKNNEEEVMIDPFLTSVYYNENKNKLERKSFDCISNEFITEDDTSEIINNNLNNQDHQDNPEQKDQLNRTARRTMMLVKARQSPFTIDKVKINFNKNYPNELPKTIKLSLLQSIIVESLEFSSIKEKNIFKNHFLYSNEIDTIIKDLFWYIVSNFFQESKNKEAENLFLERIASNFTKLFIHTNNPSFLLKDPLIHYRKTFQSNYFLDKLPDVFAQIIYHSLLIAFPISKRQLNDKIKKKILELCYSWFIGFIPLKINFNHWLEETAIKTPRKSAAAAAMNDFPALKNRLVRSERLEKIKIAENIKQQNIITSNVLNDHSNDVSTNDLNNNMKDLYNNNNNNNNNNKEKSQSLLPIIKIQEKIQERAMYSLCNSPLVTTFLKNNSLENNSKSLKVQLRLTDKSKIQYLESQNALTKENKYHLERKKIKYEYMNRMKQFNQNIIHNTNTNGIVIFDNQLNNNKDNIMNSKNINHLIANKNSVSNILTKNIINRDINNSSNIKRVENRNELIDSKSKTMEIRNVSEVKQFITDAFIPRPPVTRKS